MPDRVTFTRPAAERIGKIVRIVEAGDRDASGWQVNVRTADTPVRVRMCFWTGSWQYGAAKVVTLGAPDAAGVNATAYAVNEFFGFRGTPAFGSTSATGTGRGVVVNEAGTWRLGCYSLTQADNYMYVPPNNETIQLLGHTGELEGSDGGGEASGAPNPDGPYLKWYTITTCESTA